jgi:hypothetical protein
MRALHLGRLRATTVLLLLAAVTACRQETAETHWTLTETLRIGGAEVGPTSFDYVKSIAVDSLGRLFIYDRSTQDIRLFGADGRLVRVIGRKGSGPGELRDAEGIAFSRDGKLWARDAANGRFTIFDGEGVFERHWPMAYCSSQGAWDPRPDREGRLLDQDCVVTDGRADGDAILAYHTDLSRVDTLGLMPECGTRALAESGTWITRHANGTTYRSIPYRAASHNALGPGGEVWCVPNSSRYELLLHRPGAADTVRVALDRPALPVTAGERDSVIAQLEEKGPTGLDFSRIPTVKPAIDRLTIDDQGRLWVRRMNARGAIAFDILDPDGRLVAAAELGVHRSSVWTPFVVRGENVYAVVLDADDVQHIVRFRIGR